MAVLSRYRGLSTYEDSNGNALPRRYERIPKDREFFTIITDKPTTFDLLALQQYGSPVLYWLIADFNDYLDPTVTIPAGTKLKIPRQG